MKWLVERYVDLYCWWVPTRARWQAHRRIRRAARKAGESRAEIAARLRVWDASVDKDLRSIREHLK